MACARMLDPVWSFENQPAAAIPPTRGGALEGQGLVGADVGMEHSLLVTSSLTISTASVTSVSASRPPSCDNSDLRARSGALPPP